MRWKIREQNLQLQLGQALIANQGYQATATLQAFERALVLADEIGDVSLQLPAMFGQWAGRHIAATGSAEFARRFAALADTHPDSGARLVGLRMLALESFFESRFQESLALTQEALESYDETVHRDLCHRFGHDPRAAALNYKAWSLWHLGFPDQAAQTMEVNLRWVRELNHANTTGLVLCYGVTLVNIWLRRPERVETAAREALRLSEEMSLGLWHVWAQSHFGWALSQQDKATGIEEIEAGLSGARQIGAGRLEPFHLALAAEILSRAGRHGEAASRMDLAFQALGRRYHSYLTAELHRVRAALLLRAGQDQRGPAEADLRRALEITRQQESPALQLRAARDLAWLLAEQGERRQAYDLLAPIHGWFTEGFATPDLIEAKALLEELHH
jgi:adenylate cyclase